jgi:hypothetical protein
MSIFFNAATLSLLGFTIELTKSVWTPELALLHLGLIFHSDSRQFEKKERFAVLREEILASESVYLKTLQKLMGKCVSFQLCIPAARLYIRLMAREIGKATKYGSLIKIQGELREEIEFWRFLDHHTEWATWRGERHVDLTLFTDSSGFAWGA